MKPTLLKKTRWMIAGATFSFVAAAAAYTASGGPASTQAFPDPDEKVQAAPADRTNTPAARSGWNKGSYDAGNFAPKAIHRFGAGSAGHPSAGAGQVDNTCSQPGFNQRNKQFGQNALLC